MLLTRRLSPFPAVRNYRSDIDRLFDELKSVFDHGAPGTPRAFPPINLWEEGEKFVVETEVPGLKMEQLEVLVSGNELTIKGRRDFVRDEKTTVHRRERHTGEFTRMFTLPAEIDADNVDATLKDGVLTISLPKAKEALARKIEVKTA